MAFKERLIRLTHVLNGDLFTSEGLLLPKAAYSHASMWEKYPVGQNREAKCKKFVAVQVDKTRSSVCTSAYAWERQLRRRFSQVENPNFNSCNPSNLYSDDFFTLKGPFLPKAAKSHSPHASEATPCRPTYVPCQRGCCYASARKRRPAALLRDALEATALRRASCTCLHASARCYASISPFSMSS